MSWSLINCLLTIANFGANSLNTSFFMKAILAEILCNFNLVTLILLQTRFSNVLIIDKFAIIRNSIK